MPTDHRNLALLAYLSRLDFDVTSSPERNILQCMRPFTVRWRDVAVHVCSTRVPYEQSMYALNCAVVALCRVDPALVSG